jgi:hypothetical protein
MTSARVTARFGPRIPASTSGATPPRIIQELSVSAAARQLPDQRSRVTETSASGPLPLADQRNARYAPLVFLTPLFLGGVLLLAMCFFVAPAVFLAARFLAPF